MRQQRAMGIMYAQRYGSLVNNTWLSSTVCTCAIRSHKFNVRSTDVDRTLMSAESQLAGWFPPAASPFDDPDLLWRPVPVHTLPESSDRLLTAGGVCPDHS